MLPAYLASLRVFSPLGTFPSGEQRRWERYIAAGRAPDRTALVESERAAGMVAAIRPSLDVDEEHALVEKVDGVTFICPARTQLRVWEAAAEFREGLPDLLADSFIPRLVADAAATSLAGLREVSPGLLAHTRTTSWSVPLAWFLLFAAEEREQHEEVLRYATTMSSARRRAARTLKMLNENLPQAPTTAELEDVARWLGLFHARSRLELDYGGLGALLGAAALAEDTSVADLAAGLSALGEGDGAAAGRAYERVAERWRDAQLRETAS